MPKGEVYVRETGTGDHTVVLLHGFSDHSGTWCRVAPTLSERYRVLAVDLPGFGRSAEHWTAPLFDHYVDVLDDLLAGTEKPVSLIGNSLGAVTSLVYASARPARVRRVVLSDMPGVAGIPRLWTRGARLPVELSRLLTRPVPAPLVQRTIGALYARAAVHRPGSLDRAVRTAFSANFATRRQVDALLSVGRHAIHELGRLPIPEMVHALDMPALLVWGARDRLTPANAARRVDADGTRRVVIIPDAGHCPHLDAPQEFLDVVLPFLE
ncbi:alpha/beta hydrolase [Rhodococcus sp. Z13]|uniref:Alpha/beta hydrolase n=1 Tax=Rhodococcus sacchari TaxID=2962047 RepID=A0ACD4DJA0_9NOCA|nr:alpha/beta hydrolase [Rhodococcus sp. Z13]UYP20097.1 alpha/beta hydrolase [Rhodococcus sp. Z13]